MIPFSNRELISYLFGRVTPDLRQAIDQRAKSDVELAARLVELRREARLDWKSDAEFNDFADDDSAEDHVADIESTLKQVTQCREFRELRDDVRMGKVVLFGGPELSRAAGLNSRDMVSESLSWKIARRLELDEDPVEIERLRALGLNSLADLYSHLFGPMQFQQAVHEALYECCPDGTEHLDLHAILLQIPFAITVSTAWDDLFEQAGRRLEPPRYLSPIATDADLLGLCHNQETVFLQPRGSIRRGTAFSADQQACDLRHPALTSFLHNLFLTHRLLFVGYDVNDADLLHYYHVFRRHFGDQARRLWAQSYTLGLGMPKAGVERLRQMGLRVIAFDLPLADLGPEAARTKEFAALRRFLQLLLDETRPDVTLEERARRIADFLNETPYARRTIRVRAGLSPIGLPEQKQLNEFTPPLELLSVCPFVGGEQEYEQQKRLKDSFLGVLESAVTSEHDVFLILSVDFEDLQARSAHKQWLELQLQNLIDFCEHGLGSCPQVKVLDRHGSYEVQQMLLDDREMVESRKFDPFNRDYHLARVSKDPREVKAAVEVYDLCFRGIAAMNLEAMLAGDSDPGRKHLVSCIHQALDEGRIADLFRSPPVAESHARRLGAQLRGLTHPSFQELETLLCTAPPHSVLAALEEQVVFEAIKLHLIAQWKHELRLLSETRTSWWDQVTDQDGNPKGELDKVSFHALLREDRPIDLYNLHVSGFALTIDAQHLILRKRVDVQEDIFFDPARWDRTIHGHVRNHSTYSREFRTEVLHHFAQSGIEGCCYVTLQQFLEHCRERRAARNDLGLLGLSAFYETDVFAFPLHAGPIRDVYQRHRASDGAVVREPVRTMLYLSILPIAELPRHDPTGKHFTDWALVPLEKITQLVNTQHPVQCATCGSGAVEIRGTDLTDEARKLLKICHDEVLVQLQAPAGTPRRP